MKKLTRIVVSLALATHVAGCASIGKHVQNIGSSESNIYAGTRLDCDVLRLATGKEQTDRTGEEWARSLTPLVVVDLPFSFVMDTALLPIDAIRQGVIASKTANEE